MNFQALIRGWAVCGAVCALTLGAVAEEHTMDVFAKLRSVDPAVRDAATTEIMAARKETIRKCEDIVRDSIKEEDRRGTAATSILLLGKLRSQESAPLLVEYLTFEVFYKETKRPQTLEDRHPCVKALIEIGIPSVDLVLDKATKSQEARVIECSSKVLRGVLGDDIAKAYVERRMARDSQIAGKDALSRILKALQQ